MSDPAAPPPPDSIGGIRLALLENQGLAVVIVFFVIGWIVGWVPGHLVTPPCAW